MSVDISFKLGKGFSDAQYIIIHLIEAHAHKNHGQNHPLPKCNIHALKVDSSTKIMLVMGPNFIHLLVHLRLGPGPCIPDNE